MNYTNFVNRVNFLVVQNKILLFYGKKHLSPDFFLNVMSFRALNFSNSEKHLQSGQKKAPKFFIGTFRALKFSKYEIFRVLKFSKNETFRALKLSNLAILSGKNFRVRFPSKSGEF